MIKLVQLDPNGLCNLGCWFCPVAYEENPAIGRKTMEPSTIRNIVEQIKSGVGDFVDPDFITVYTARYNEILLYKHFKEMLDIFREHKLYTVVLTNGLALTKEKTDLITEYKDVVWGIHFNVPSANPETWAKMTNKNPKMHERVMQNIRYAIDTFPVDRISLGINGINQSSSHVMTILENAPDIDLDDETGDTAIAYKEMKERFPEIEIGVNSSLVDRAGYLDVQKIIKNNISHKGKVIGCSNMGSRTETWLHINANGDVFICCNDYNFETVFGNIHETSIKDIWNSQARRDMIDHSYKGFCTTCVHAIWEE